MSGIRVLVIGLPLLLCGVVAASFISEKTTVAQRKNQLISASIGEPHNLNPIQDADAAAGEVQSWVCNALVKYDENLEIIGDLADKWEQTQTTTVFFFNDTDARAETQKVTQAKARWPAWHLVSADQRESELRLVFSLPGPEGSREILALLDPARVAPLTSIRVELKSAAPQYAAHFRQTAVSAQQIKREWIDSSGAFEFTVAGDAKIVLDELQRAFTANPSLAAKVTPGDKTNYLQEPEIVFHLHPGVKWHDGAPFTARDVVFTYQKIMDETVVSPRKPDYDLFSSVEAPDPLTVRVVCRKPYSLALNSWMIPLIPEHILAGKTTQWWAENFNRKLVGTGPFKFGEWKTNEYISLNKNPDYFKSPPHLDNIILRTLPDPLTLRLAFETRQTDSWGIDPWSIGRFRNDPRFDIIASPGNRYEYVGWNLRRPLFQDKKVRQALAHAVDVGSIIQYVLYGNGTQSTGNFPPKMWFFNADVKPFAYDPELSKKMLAEAGWTPGTDGMLAKNGERFAFTLITNNGNETRKDIATLVQADLRKIGIDVKVEIYEWAVFLDKHVDTADFDAVVLGWGLSEDYDQYQLWHSSQAGPKQLNFCAYKNPEVDHLLEQIRVEYDRATIKSIAGRLQQTIYDDQPYLFLEVPKPITALWKDTFRVLRPAVGQWLDEPIRETKAGASIYQEWFYRPQYRPQLAPN